MLRRLLLLPLLLPLLAVLLVAGLNPRPQLSLRLLTWRSPPLPLGAWIALAAGSGAAITTAATALALAAPGRPLRRRLHRDAREPQPSWAEFDRFSGPVGNDPRAAADTRPPSSRGPAAGRSDAGPSRAPGEPAPTVEVPFRVIRRGTQPAAERPATASERPATAAERPAPAAPGAQAQPSDDDWDTPASDSW